MPTDATRKRAIRARMQATGENYTTAARHVDAAGDSPPANSATVLRQVATPDPDTTFLWPPTPGSALRNGATVIDVHLTDPSRAIVLALRDTPGNPDKYVTWEIASDGDTYWGHYHRDLTEAVTDYRTRAHLDRVHPTSITTVLADRDVQDEMSKWHAASVRLGELTEATFHAMAPTGTTGAFLVLEDHTHLNRLGEPRLTEVLRIGTGTHTVDVDLAAVRDTDSGIAAVATTHALIEQGLHELAEQHTDMPSIARP